MFFVSVKSAGCTVGNRKSALLRPKTGFFDGSSIQFCRVTSLSRLKNIIFANVTKINSPINSEPKEISLKLERHICPEANDLC